MIGRRAGIPRRAAALLAAGLAALPGCRDDSLMLHQPKVRPMAESAFFAAEPSTRPRVPGTVPRDASGAPSAAERDGTPERPALDRALLRRGRERFDIFCAVCHGRDGYGRGMVVQRGFPAAASYHIDRLRAADDEYLYSVITDGYRNMPAYGAMIAPADRWAIVAYVRALQLSQHARLIDVPEDRREAIGAAAAEGH